MIAQAPASIQILDYETRALSAVLEAPKYDYVHHAFGGGDIYILYDGLTKCRNINQSNY